MYEITGTDLISARLKTYYVPTEEEPLENTNGVVKVSITAYGDAPEIPFIRAEALTKEKAIRAYKRAYAIYSGHVFDE